MKKNKKFDSTVRKKLSLSLEHIVQLTPTQLNAAHGASTAIWSCTISVCGKSE
jgi:hypothetical protein